MTTIYLAQALHTPGGDITGPLTANGNTVGARFTNLSSLVTFALPLIFSIAGLILLAYLVWGGFDFLMSMGEPEKAESGKAKITNAIIGFVIIFVSYWLVQIVQYLLGIK